jgi:hypothetical protein
MADLLPGWKADLISRTGRKIHVQFVLTAIIIYLAMALDLPAWAHKAIDKIRRSYFWRGHKEAKGGHCLVAWDKVCQPIEMGGLGISNLKMLGWALRTRWLWLKKTEPHRPWASLEVQVPDQVRALFAVATITEVGNGAGTMFWKDRWLHGQQLADLGPSLFAAIPQRKRQQHTVETALQNHAWVSDIRGSLTIDIIVDYIQVWELINELQLLPEVVDAHRWRLDSTGQYSSKSAYDNLFLGATLFLVRESGSLGHHPNVRCSCG